MPPAISSHTRNSAYAPISVLPLGTTSRPAKIGDRIFRSIDAVFPRTAEGTRWVAVNRPSETTFTWELRNVNSIGFDLLAHRNIPDGSNSAFADTPAPAARTGNRSSDAPRLGDRVNRTVGNPLPKTAPGTVWVVVNRPNSFITTWALRKDSADSGTGVPTSPPDPSPTVDGSTFTATPVGGLADASDLHPDLVTYGVFTDDAGIPTFLTDAALKVDQLFNFYSTSGIHLGGGFWLTARHIYDTMDLNSPAGAFVGSKRLNTVAEMSVRILPKRGSYNNSYGLRSAAGYGTENDWALIEFPDSAANASIRGIRRTSSLKLGDSDNPGEQVWVIGDKTFGKVRVSSGRLTDITGNNATLSDCLVEPGFSGSPVVDSDGYLVGIVYVQGPNYAKIITTDAIVDVLSAARDAGETIPNFEIVS